MIDLSRKVNQTYLDMTITTEISMMKIIIEREAILRISARTIMTEYQEIIAFIIMLIILVNRTVKMVKKTRESTYHMEMP